MRRWGAVLLTAALLGCPLLDGGGGGGGGGTVNFLRGFVYVRKDDRNLYVADQSDYSKVARLTTTGNARHPSLSADGKRVVFVRAAGAETELMTVPASGGQPTLVLASTATWRNFKSPVFSPEGSRIAFAYDEGASSALGIVNADGSGFARLAGGGALSYGSPSFFADGTSVLAMAGNSASTFTQLERVAIATGQATNVTNNLGSEVVQIANRVVVSPDGTRAAFDGRLSSNAVRIFIINLSSKQVTRLTDYPSDPTAQDGFPTWIGTERVGFSSDTGGSDQVYTLPASASKTSGGLELPSAIEPWFGPT
ncbi:MAG: PD40 domain-containing protein [Myxococcales bacterium]|nr:PD40 domain-containing protein [Myxococcales bacterium]